MSFTLSSSVSRSFSLFSRSRTESIRSFIELAIKSCNFGYRLLSNTTNSFPLEWLARERYRMIYIGGMGTCLIRIAYRSSEFSINRSLHRSIRKIFGHTLSPQISHCSEY
jgi:hypothetical protein